RSPVAFVALVRAPVRRNLKSFVVSSQAIMEYLQQAFSVKFEYRVFFTEDLFSPQNKVFSDFLDSVKTDTVKKIYTVIDSGDNDHPRAYNCTLPKRIGCWGEERHQLFR